MAYRALFEMWGQRSDLGAANWEAAERAQRLRATIQSRKYHQGLSSPMTHSSCRSSDKVELFPNPFLPGQYTNLSSPTSSYRIFGLSILSIPSPCSVLCYFPATFVWHFRKSFSRLAPTLPHTTFPHFSTRSSLLGMQERWNRAFFLSAFYFWRGRFPKGKPRWPHLPQPL